MKKSITIFLITAFYLMSTSGMAISIHYCMGKVSSFELFASKKKPCCCGEKKETKSCCKDEFKQLKIDSSKLSQTIVKFQNGASSVSTSKNILFVNAVYTNASFSKYPNEGDFIPHKVPIYIKNQVFLI